MLNLAGQGKPIGYVNQDTFLLPELGPILRQEARALQAGPGFFVLRGLLVDKYSREENIIIYAGVSSYIGGIRGRQGRATVDGVSKSTMLNHIKDLSQTAVAKNIGAPAYTTDKQVFHTDAGDIVSLFSLNTAAQGGESKLASSWRVYNEIARTRPDVIKTLAEDWAFDGQVRVQITEIDLELIFVATVMPKNRTVSSLFSTIHLHMETLLNVS